MPAMRLPDGVKGRHTGLTPAPENSMNPSITDRFVSIVGSYQVDPQDAAAFAEIAAQSVADTIHKRGCLYYIAAQDVTQSNVFHLAEGWASQADLDEHVASPAFKAMLEEAFKLRIVKRAIYLSESTGRKLMT
jgi:quinol monooxygenase YgiN